MSSFGIPDGPVSQVDHDQLAVTLRKYKTAPQKHAQPNRLAFFIRLVSDYYQAMLDIDRAQRLHKPYLGLGVLVLSRIANASCPRLVRP